MSRKEKLDIAFRVLARGPQSHEKLQFIILSPCYYTILKKDRRKFTLKENIFLHSTRSIIRICLSNFKFFYSDFQF